MYSFKISSILFILFLNYPGSEGSAAENELIKTLLDPNNYNKNVIPQVTLDGPLKLNFGVSLLSIMEINESAQTMKSKLQITMQWTDGRLKYDAQQLNGVSSKLQVPLINIWKPSPRLANSYGTPRPIESDSVYAQVFSNGEVIVFQSMVALSSCTIDVTYFPYDQQTCILKFYVEGYNGHEVMMGLYNDRNFISLNEYSISERWSIIEVPAYLNVYNAPEARDMGHVATSRRGSNISSGGASEVDITFYVTLRRKSSIFTWTIVIPVFFSAILTIFSFVLPIESREKLICGLASVVSLIFLLVSCGSLLPSFSLVIPVFLTYHVYLLIISVLSLVSTAIIVHLSSNASEMPELIRKVFLDKLGKLFQVVDRTSSSGEKAAAIDSVELNSPAEDSNHRNSATRVSEATTGAEGCILASLKNLKSEKEAKESWKTLATVLDRILFLISLLVTLLTIISFIANGTPHAMETVEEEKIIGLYAWESERLLF